VDDEQSTVPANDIRGFMVVLFRDRNAKFLDLPRIDDIGGVGH
jgi:hypothetical protein